MKTKKLSDRAILVLMAIRDRCNWPEVNRWWLAGELRGSSDWIEELNLYANINGAGDAKILRTLKERGLIKRPQTEMPTEYVYVITEDGVVAIEEAREAGRLQQWIDKVKARQAEAEKEEQS